MFSFEALFLKRKMTLKIRKLMKYIFLFFRTTLLEFVCVSEIDLTKYIKRYNYIEKKN